MNFSRQAAEFCDLLYINWEFLALGYILSNLGIYKKSDSGKITASDQSWNKVYGIVDANARQCGFLTWTFYDRKFSALDILWV